MKALCTILLSTAVKASHFSREQYDSGEVHQMILDMKNVGCAPPLLADCH